MEKSIHLFVYKRVRAIYTVMEIEQACTNWLIGQKVCVKTLMTLVNI